MKTYTEIYSKCAKIEKTIKTQETTTLLLNDCKVIASNILSVCVWGNESGWNTETDYYFLDIEYKHNGNYTRIKGYFDSIEIL